MLLKNNKSNHIKNKVIICQKMNSINTTSNEMLEHKNKKNGFGNLKSDFIFKKIIDYIKKNKSLEIMKHNKALQKRLSLGINNYKDFCQLYTPIEIEIKLDENKYGEFIKINNKEKDYYHNLF